MEVSFKPRLIGDINNSANAFLCRILMEFSKEILPSLMEDCSLFSIYSFFWQWLLKVISWHCGTREKV